MKLHAQTDEGSHIIDIKANENGVVVALVDGREYTLEASTPEPNVYLFKHNNQIFEIAVSLPQQENQPVAVRLGNHNIDVNLSDPKKLRGSSAADVNAGGSIDVKTAMPGKIVKILVAAGDEVEKGQGILVVEAMKMQNELKAPKNGVVTNIKVAESATVSAGDILLTIE